jgi:hypothetical protein
VVQHRLKNATSTLLNIIVHVVTAGSKPSKNVCHTSGQGNRAYALFDCLSASFLVFLIPNPGMDAKLIMIKSGSEQCASATRSNRNPRSFEATHRYYTVEIQIQRKLL